MARPIVPPNPPSPPAVGNVHGTQRKQTPLLGHNPDYAQRMPDRPRVDLMLAGHSHGGQIRIPGYNPATRVLRHPRYTQGLVQGPACPVYVSAGLGTMGPPIRFRCRPELAVLTLVSASG